MMPFLRKYWPVVLMVVFFLGYFLTRPHAYYGDAVQPPQPTQGFTLQSASGPVSLDDFKGKYVLLYYGYTNCPEICPTTMNTIARAYGLLGGLAGQLQTVMVSVDPARDTPEKLAEYVSVFDPTFVGVTGSKDQIDALTQANGIYYKIDPEGKGGSDYEVDHTASLQVLDPAGRLVLLIPYGNTAEQIADDLAYLLAHPEETQP